MKEQKLILPLVILGIIWVATLTSCSVEDESAEVRLSDCNLMIQELVSVVYSDQEILEISSYDGNLFQYDSYYPAECVREHLDGCRIAYLGENSVALIWFDQKGTKSWSKVFSLQYERSDIERLEIGDSIRAVQEIDPSGEYPFLYVGRTDAPKFSVHFTKDGYELTITYDNDHCISGFEWRYI